MNFSSALNEISKEFKISIITNKIANIFINKLIDESNYYFICLKESDNNLILTDCGKTLELLEDKELLKRICLQYNFQLNKDEIFCNYNNISDLYEFIKLLDILTNNI